jgi:shikimate dehydrogenase
LQAKDQDLSASTKTHFACVFGNPIEQSKSPIIHNLFAKQFNISLNYEKKLADADAFSKAADQFFSSPCTIGANVTMPFKHDALAWVNELSLQAKRAGAVNTIIRTETGFRGDNTDGIGLVNDLQNHDIKLPGTRLLLIGAGGAAKGALPALIEAGVEDIILYNRDKAKAEQLIKSTELYAPGVVQAYEKKHGDFDLIINATSLSLNDGLPDLPDTIFETGPAIYDMVYKSQPTVFMKHAKKQGCSKILDGLGMLVEQAAHSFYLWFGVKPNTQTVFENLRDVLNNNK